MSHREVNAASRLMCLPYLQAPRAPAVRESTSPDKERRRKTPHRDRQCTDNGEGRSTPVVAHQDMSAMAEAESADISMAETEPADISMAETEPADVSMAEAESGDANMSPEK